MKRILYIAGFLVAGIAAAQQPPAPASPAVTLEQAVQEAMTHNLTLAAEKLNVSVAEAREITARLRPNPVLTVSATTLNLLRADYSSVSPLGPNQLTVHTDLPLERGGKRNARIVVAKEEKSLAELGVREVMRQVIASVQNAYVDVQQAKANLKLAQENLETVERVVAINEQRHRAGDLALVELDRSRVAALQYRTAVRQAELNLDQAKTELRRTMGRRGMPDIEVSDQMRRDAYEGDLPLLTETARKQRPDFLVMGQSQVRSQADLRLQLANGRVDHVIGTEVTRQWAYGYAGQSIGFSYSIPLPVYNRNQGEIARAQREIQLAGARKEAMHASLDAEAEKAFRQFTVARELLRSVEADMLAKARSVRDTTEYSYKRGEASLVEFLDAQRAFNDAMQTFNDARANYARSLYLIDTVAGTTVSGS